ncbi:tyrosine-protein phosphatase [Aurantiacibacter poecillastricola]|uniref:tyrosine-protein phosphatase n=1 Tax=Aurantiacibacter poecillastricola TaxID=3064385 RepID=UPI00273EE356|nr:tyrosine-protein phosphatase [Aurantiacibacter sp. 219JJ12-13]MDP5261344.1 tyrosine-protein phosphatase [Aurantiacibacter sp. 219JJ12-13]
MTLTGADRERILTLEGARNFRDFGGYLTQDGGKVRRGMLFRSNRLSQLTPGDIALLEETGIATIFDLRAPREREADPTAWQAAHLDFHSWPPGHKRRLVDMALEYPPTAKGAEALMADFYADLPRMMAHAFGGILARIADGAAPCIIHCSAGKDRTGMAAALILSAVGVPRESVLDDYAMTDRIVASEDDMARSLFTGKSGGDRAKGSMRERFPPEAIAVMRSARPSFLESAFAGIERDYGTLPEYFAAIGANDAVLGRLRKLLVEPA